MLKHNNNPHTTKINDQITFLELFGKCIAYRAETKEKFETRSTGTIKNYHTKHRILSQFLSENEMVDLKATDFDNNVLREFSEWLADHQYQDNKFYSHNYMCKMKQYCKMVLQLGAVNEWISFNPLQYSKFKKALPSPPPYFTPEQIKVLEEYRPNSSMKSKAHVMAIVQIHTGFDYGDLFELKRSHVIMHKNRKFISKHRHKNGYEAIVPVSEVLESYLEKHKYSIGLLSNQKYNQALKEIGMDLDLKINLTSKVFRKLFLMNMLNNQGVSMEAVSKMAGHKSIITTEMYYARPNINLIGKELDKLGL